MPRYKLTIEYDGSALAGWQRQENGPSAQGHLEEAIRRFTGETVTVYGAGRTDSGVHATGQVAHIDLPKAYPPFTIQGALNFHMKPAPVGVIAVEEVSSDFHARFSAIRRTYRYRILQRKAPPILELGRIWHVKEKLNIEAMQEAAKLLIGHHDFSTFRTVACQAKSPMKTLESITISAQGEEIHFIVSAPSFLHHMVRNLVGTLKLVGSGKWDSAKLAEALAAKDRRCGGPTAPADGLYFIRVDY